MNTFIHRKIALLLLTSTSGMVALQSGVLSSQNLQLLYTDVIQTPG